MGCIEQKLGSGVTEFKKWYFHLFLSNLPRKAFSLRGAQVLDHPVYKEKIDF